VDLSALTPDPDLAALIGDLPGRRVVFTNADRAYAARVLQARGLSGVFDAVYGVEDAGYAPKPQAAAFARVFGAEGLDPIRAAMFEDDHRNLQVPHGLGLQTVLVAETRPDLAHVQHHAPDLGPFLARLLAALSGHGTGG
jgi:putative hydrolase of the HAD superfamily